MLDNLKTMVGKIRRNSKNSVKFLFKSKILFKNNFLNQLQKQFKKASLKSLAFFAPFTKTAKLKSLTPILIQLDNKNSRSERI